MRKAPQGHYDNVDILSSYSQALEWFFETVDDSTLIWRCFVGELPDDRISAARASQLILSVASSQHGVPQELEESSGHRG